MKEITDTLIIHVGPSKTGTSTLQKNCFGVYPNAVTKYNNWREELKVKELVDLFLFHTPKVWNTKRGKEYIELLKKTCSKTSGKPLFISVETISRSPFFRYKVLKSYSDNYERSFPVTLHLEELLNICDWISKVKIIITLRNQPQWLASRYAGDSKTFCFPFSASQEDFERRVDNLLQDESLEGGGYLNWGKLVQDLIKIAGKENVYVLLLEEIQKQSYWEQLAEATELPFNPSEYRVYSSERANVLGSRPNEWKIQSNRFSIFNSNHAKYVLNHNDLSKLPFLRFFGKVIKTQKKSDFIYLKEETIDEILKFCSPFNQQLAKCMGRDIDELKKIGY